MAGKRQIVVEVVGNASGGVKALAQVDQAAGGLEKTISGKAQGAVSNFSSALSSKLGPAGGLVKGQLDKLGQSALASGGMLQTAAVGGVAALGAGLIKMGSDGVRAFLDLSGQVRGFMRVAGTSAEESSKLVYAANALGVGSENAAAGIFKLSKNLETSADKMLEAGVQTAFAKDGTIDLEGTLLNAADAYKNAGSAAEKNAIAFAAFGKSGQALLPILAQGRDGLKAFFDEADKHHQILSQDDLDKAKEMKAAMRNLSAEFKGLEMEIGRGALPAVTNLLQVLETLLEAAEKAGKGVKSVLEWTPSGKNGIRDLVESQRDVKDTAADAADAQDKLKKDMQAAADAADEEKKAQEDLARAIDDATNAAEASIDANLGLQRANLQVKDALQNVTEKTKALSDARKQHGINSKEAKAAEEDLAKAQLDAVGAANSAAGAAQKVAENTAAIKGATFTAKDGMDVYRANLQFMANAMDAKSPVRQQLQALIDALPTDADLNKTGHINVDTAAAQQNLADLNAAYGRLSPELKGLIGPSIGKSTIVPPGPKGVGAIPGLIPQGGTGPAGGGKKSPTSATGLTPGASIVVEPGAPSVVINSSPVFHVPASSDGEMVKMISAEIERNNLELVRQLAAQGVR